MALTIEQLEPRILAASIAYSIATDAGDTIQVGQQIEVAIFGQATYDDAPPVSAGVFSWGVEIEWNDQWLTLDTFEIATDYGWLPLAEPTSGSTVQGLDLGGILDFDALPLSGTDPVLLATVTIDTQHSSVSGTLAGVQLRAGSRSSAILGVNEYVSADTTGAWQLFAVASGPDVDGDGIITPVDALQVVNCFLDADQPRHDVDGDGDSCTPADVLAVFAELGA